MPTAPQNTSSAIAAIVVVSSPLISSIDSRMFSVPVLTQMSMMPRAKPTSPTRLTMNAFFAARAADQRVYQKPIRRYELRPTSSQAAKTVSQLSPRTSSSMLNMNRLR